MSIYEDLEPHTSQFVVMKPLKVYTKKKTTLKKVIEGGVTQYGSALNKTYSKRGIVKSDHVIDLPGASKHNIFRTEAHEQATVNISGTRKDSKPNKTSIEGNTDNIIIKNEIKKEPDDNTEENTVVKQEPGVDIKAEPLYEVEIDTEYECAEPFNFEVELTNPSGPLNCDTESNDVESLNVSIKEEPADFDGTPESQPEISVPKTKASGEIQTNSTNKEILETLTEELIIKDEHPTENDIDISTRQEEVECNDPEIECNDPEVECDDPEVESDGPEIVIGSESVQFMSGSFELIKDVNNPNRWYAIPKNSRDTILLPATTTNPRPKVILKPRRTKKWIQPPSPISEPHSHKPRTDEIEPVGCPLCDAEFYELSELKRHLAGGHKGDARMFECNMCASRFKHKYLLKVHMRIHELEELPETIKEFRCDKCGRKCKTRRGLEKHMNSHTKERVFMCPTCGATFTEKSCLLTHMIKHTPDEEHICNFCSKSFKDIKELRAHSKVHMTVFPCKVCGEKFSGEIELHDHMGKHTRLLECMFCLKQFVDAEELKNHMVTHEGMMEKVQDKSLVCTHCGKRFLYRSVWLAHERTHTGERPYACADCGQTFKTSGARNEHVRGHKRNHTCSDCGKAFARASTLEIHRRLHTGEKPYSCHICGTAFAQRSSLNIHLKRHHGTQLRPPRKPVDITS